MTRKYPVLWEKSLGLITSDSEETDKEKHRKLIVPDVHWKAFNSLLKALIVRRHSK